MTTPPAFEVRRCSKCQEPAAICIRDWRHTTMGLPSGRSTRDFCCQACGHRFTLAPTMRLWVYAIGGTVFCFTCILPLVFGGIAGAGAWPYYANPVVPDAPVPAIRFTAEEPTRRCASCGGVARCRTVTRRRSSGIPTGTDFGYTCEGCGRTFTTASPGSHVVNALGATVCFALGLGCMPAGLLVWVLGLGVLVLSAVQIVAEVRNPLIAEPVEA